MIQESDKGPLEEDQDGKSVFRREVLEPNIVAHRNDEDVVC